MYLIQITAQNGKVGFVEDAGNGDQYVVHRSPDQVRDLKWEDASGAWECAEGFVNDMNFSTCLCGNWRLDNQGPYRFDVVRMTPVPVEGLSVTQTK